MTKLLARLTLISLFLVGIGCRKCVEVPCEISEAIQLQIIGYPLSESDTLLLCQYQSNTNFAQTIDSTFIYPSLIKSDTSFFFALDQRLGWIHGNQVEYDWAIKNPSDLIEIRIFGIKRGIATRKQCRGGLFGRRDDQTPCLNPLLEFGFNVNSGSVQIVGNTLRVYK